MTAQGEGAEPIIQAKALSKWYVEVIGLNNFAVRVMPGITGIVGPNGSGKSTFFKLVLGLVLGIIRIRANTSTAMITHAVYNIALGLMAFFSISFLEP